MQKNTIILTAVTTLILLLSVAAWGMEINTGDGLHLITDEANGLIKGLSVNDQFLFTSNKYGGFYIGEYLVNPGPELINKRDLELLGNATYSGGWQLDHEVFHSSGASLMLDASKGGQLQLPVAFQAERVYRISYYIKTEALESPLILHVRRMNNSGTYIGRQSNFEHLGIYHHEWVYVEHTIQTLPGTTKGELMFHVPWGDEGKVWIDGLSVQELRQPELTLMKGSFSLIGDELLFRGEWEGIQLEAIIKGEEGFLSFSGFLQDITGEDRAVQLEYRLPINAEGWIWQTSIDGGERIRPGRMYTTATEIGRNTNRYISPWPYSSLDGPRVGLSLSVPMDQPSVYLMYYSSKGDYTIHFDFGLTQDTTKFPGRAEFAFNLSHHDPNWGLRSAAEKYFNNFPQFFEVRIPPGSVFQGGLALEVKDLTDFGAMYGDRRNFAAKSNLRDIDYLGMLSMTYGEPWMWRSKFAPYTKTSELPSPEEIVQNEKTDIEVWNQNDSGDYFFISRAYSTRAFLNSVFYDEHDNPIVNASRTYGAGNRVVEWVTNPNPYIEGEYGTPNRGLLSWEYEVLDDQQYANYYNLQLPGVRYDSLGEWVHLGAENHRKQHFAYAQVPLTFSYRTGRPVQLGYFTAVEYMNFVREELLKHDGFTYANGATGVPWFLPLLDGVFLEDWNWKEEMNVYQHTRLLAYQKNVGGWGGINIASAEQTEQALNNCLTYAWWPGISGTSKQLDAVRPIYNKYIPVLKELSLAGWEPVTHALADKGNVLVERFGGRSGRPLYYTVRNTSSQKREITVTIDLEALGYSTNLITDSLERNVLFESDNVLNNQAVVKIEVPANRTIVLEVHQAEN